MDARPQRPMRSRTIRDENLPPSVIAGKTIHQRNKSSPALSMLAKNQTLKAGPKRTVFADVSNTTRSTRMVQDDSVVGAKPTEVFSKPQQLEIRPVPAPLTRPPQRPQSVNLKGVLNDTAAKQPSSELPPSSLDTKIAAQPQQPPARKILSKKSTAVFHDENSAQSGTTRPEPEKKIPVHFDTSIESNDGLIIEVRDPRTGFSRQLVQNGSVTHPGQIDHDGFLEALEARAREERLRKMDLEVFAEHDRNWLAEAREANGEPLFPVANTFLPSHVNEQQPSELKKVADMQLSTQDSRKVDEVDESWDEQVPIGEQYLDDGYNNSKSCGDYTTGQTTVFLAPKVTAKVEHELAAAARFVRESAETIELEEDEAWDTSMVAEYGDEIFGYMRHLEETMRPNPYYMANQTEIQWSMRSVLMDWLVQVHQRFGLLPETLFLCVNYIDRFLSCKVVSLGKLQLVGATAIFVASKYEEVNCPSIQEIVYMVDNGYSVDEILKAERFMLGMLQFELGWPGPMSFLRRVSKADDYDLETRTLAKYFLELTIMDERFVGCIPSFTAAGAHCLSRLMLRKGTWTQRHVYYSNYTYSQLRPLVMAMVSCCEDPRTHHLAIYEKYCDKRFRRASLFVQQEMLRGFIIPPLPQISTITNGDHSRDIPSAKYFT